jgi:hypothetical protein
VELVLVLVSIILAGAVSSGTASRRGRIGEGRTQG